MKKYNAKMIFRNCLIFNLILFSIKGAIGQYTVNLIEINAQDGTSIKSKKKKRQKQETSWSYHGGFEKFDPIEQETAPGMILILGGGYKTNDRLPFDLRFSEQDSLVNKIDTRTSPNNRRTLGSYYISKNEVTNKEYREFVDWVKVRKAMDILAANHPSKRLSNGNYNEEIPIDWKDPVLLQYFSPNGSYKGNTNQLFYNYTVTKNDSIKTIDSIQIAIYPDTLCWLREYDLNTFKRFAHSIYNNGKLMMPSDTMDVKFWKSYFEKDVKDKTIDFVLYQKIDSMLNYFSDTKYNDYPVVGVTWNQANAYCQWRSDRVNENILLRERILDKKSHYFTTESYLNTESSYNGRKIKNEEGILLPNFRLPTNSEWEYAAIYLGDSGNVNHYYPWGSNEVMDKKGRYHANFGRILDQNGLMIKTLAEDRFLFTSPVGSFKPSQTGLNDMAGNVSEWVMDVSAAYVWRNYDYSSNFFTEINKNNSRRAFTLAFEELRESGLIEDSICKSNRDLINEYLHERIQLEETIKHNHLARVVKGGSWADGSLYMIPFVDTFYKEDASSAKIGFRVAMDRVGGSYGKEYKRKNNRYKSQ